ncbi:MAG: hypothetical protein EPO21_03950 [Chloroflexota bacterium]|nr:MAG: hypothetical protein EPO21_03950 [Chloroflexota bacterium]
MRFRRTLCQRLGENRGAAALWGAMAAVVLALSAAAVLDVYQLSITRNWAYQIASEAALRGVSWGRDFASVAENGGMRLDETTAIEEATSAVEAALAERGVARYLLDVRALPEGGTETGFPPVSRAIQSGKTDWSSTEPAIGVYLELAVPVAFFGLVSGTHSVPVHAFAAAALAEAR